MKLRIFQSATFVTLGLRSPIGDHMVCTFCSLSTCELSYPCCDPASRPSRKEMARQSGRRPTGYPVACSTTSTRWGHSPASVLFPVLLPPPSRKGPPVVASPENEHLRRAADGLQRHGVDTSDVERQRRHGASLFRDWPCLDGLHPSLQRARHDHDAGRRPALLGLFSQPALALHHPCLLSRLRCGAGRGGERGPRPRVARHLARRLIPPPFQPWLPSSGSFGAFRLASARARTRPSSATSTT